MNKKTIFIFLLGVVFSAVIFGLLSWLAPKPAAWVKAPEPLALSTPLPAKPVPGALSAPSSKLSSQAPIETPAFKALFLSEADAHSLIHEVKSGENLTLISKKYRVTVELIQRINHLSNDRLSVGMKLKIPTYKFSAVSDKSQNTLILKGDEEVLKTYVVSTGENNSTPVGVFQITDRLINPTWYKAGAVVPPDSSENVLGTRWLGFTKKGYGIHGTTEPDKLGQQVTAGCIRMRNEEVEDLFAFLPSGSEVTILD